MSLKILASICLCAYASAAGPLTLATFDGSKTEFNWLEENDPVMGGKSYNCTFTPDHTNNVAIFVGEVEIVPSLKAPGFCFARTKDTKTTSFGDASEYKNLEIIAKNSGDQTQFKVCFAADTLEVQFKCFKADFNVSKSEDFQTVVVPFDSFSKEWSSATGEPTGKAPPTAKNLKDISDLQIWAEGHTGTFNLAIKEIRANN
jgi:hypothetical protein